MQPVADADPKTTLTTMRTNSVMTFVHVCQTFRVKDFCSLHCMDRHPRRHLSVAFDASSGHSYPRHPEAILTAVGPAITLIMQNGEARDICKEGRAELMGTTSHDR